MRGSAHRSFGIEVASIAGVPSSVTSRAKKILKNLEKNDVTKTMASEERFDNEETVSLSEVEQIIADADVNAMTPIEALTLLANLKNKVDKL